MASRLQKSTMGLQQIDEGDDMKFSLNTQGNSNGTGIKSVKNEEQEMTTANNNIQMHSNNSGTLVIKNTLKMAAGLALAGMIAVTATFGSVWADSPSGSVSFAAHGPNEMDIDYLNKLGNTFMVHGPNAMDTEYLNNLGNTFMVHGPNAMDMEYLNNLGNNFFVHGPDVVEPTTANAFRIHGPDVVEGSSATAFRIHGPDVVEPSSATTYRFHAPDTSEWIG